MEQNNLSKWLKTVIIGVGLCGLITYLYVLPMFGNYFVFELWISRQVLCWLIFLWITSVPCYTVLVFAWKIAANIGRDRSFSTDNARYLKSISILAAADSFFFFAGNVVYLLLDSSYIAVALLSCIVAFIGIAVSVASSALSRLVLKAAELQDQSDLTI